MNPESPHEEAGGLSGNLPNLRAPLKPVKGGGILLLLLLMLALLVAGGVIWRLRHPSAGGSPPGGADQGKRPVPVSVQPASRRGFPIYLDGLGTVQAYNSAMVNARVSGLIQEIRFREGQEVREGDVLAVIDPKVYQAQYDQAVSKLSQDSAQLDGARVLLARDKALIDKNVLDRQSYDTQLYLVAQLEGTVQADKANIDLQKSQLDWTTVTAPISGRTGVRQIDTGNLVTVGGNAANGSAAIVTINQIHPIYVSFTLPQQDLDLIREDVKSGGDLPVLALDRNNRTLLAKGTLSVVDNQIDPSTATVRLKALFPNLDDRLWPGQFVNVRLLVHTLSDAVTVPSEAVQLGPEGSYVYVIDGGKAVLRPVTTGATEEGFTLVKEGLRGGESVVTDGQFRLQPGSTVTLAPPHPFSSPAP
jgi:membrane fusion protein, multidrug efflux system